MAQSGELRGKVIDASKEPVPFASVSIELNGTQVAGTKTNFDGEYSIKPISPGRYDVKISALGFNANVTTGVVISADKTQFIDKSLSASVQEIKQVDIVAYSKPLIERDNNTTGGTLTSEEIKKLPTRSVNSAVSTTSGVYQADDNKELNVKGSRSDATQYYIDGVKVRGTANIPQQAIDQITIITGGVPAQYGDVTGGIINISTKGPSKDYYGGIEGVTSELTDAFGYNLAGANVSGPLISVNKGEENQRSVLGFFLAGEYLSQDERDPSAIGSLKLKDAKLKEIEDNPYVLSSDGRFLKRSEFVTSNDIERTKIKVNTASKDITLNARVDFQPTQNTVLAFGGSGTFIDRNSYNRDRALFNAAHNGNFNEKSYRVYGRYTQKFGSKEQEDKSLISNAYYTIQADYSRFYQVRQDPLSKDNLFNYGHVGKFETQKQRIYQI